MKSMKTFFALHILSCLLFQSEAFTQTPANKVDWYSLNMGFASSASANTMVKSAAGQAFVGTMQQSNTRIESGFFAHSLLRDPTVGVNEKEAGQEIPTHYELQQNYPNPFNPSTTIAFALPKSSTVTLKLFDMFGRELAMLAEGKLPAGRHQVVFDATAFSSGVYFYRLQANEFSQTRRLTLIK
jgi:hypothetical protein